MKTFLAWLDERTGFGKLARAALYENIPGGARWRYTWGAVLVFAIGMQFITGIFLWINYSPGAQSAWESVYYLQDEMPGGWLVRGLHHYTAQFLTVILVLHLMLVVINGAYKSPREVNFWVGLALLQVVLLMALTGYQLPWDQKGLGATKVAVSLLSVVPVIGPILQRVLIGGPDYGNLTLTRFFAIHAGVLPAAIILLLVIQFCLFRRHGFAGDKSRRRPDAPFWPDQALRDAVVCLAFAAAMLVLTIKYGAPLTAPADASEPFAAARPEWSFLFMFQFLKAFPGKTEIWGAVIIPSLVMLVIFLMPFIGRSVKGHRFNVTFLGCLLIGAGILTWAAKASDARNADYQQAVKEAEANAARVKVLAQGLGIPAGGALSLIRNDPLTQGPRLFAANCASCHRYNGTDGAGHPVKDPQSASDLAGFGSRAWIEGLLDPARIASTNYFGGTKLKDGKMIRFVKKDVAAYTPEEKEQLKQVIIALSAEARLNSQTNADLRDAALIKAGRGFLTGSLDCVKCHSFHEESGETAPDLTGYGSHEWLVKFLHNPAHESLYGDDNDRMPAFGEKQILTPEAIGLLADWLRADWYEPPATPVRRSSR